MSKLSHSSDEFMRQIERDAAIRDGNLRRCTICEAENIVDDPDCPRGAVGCNVVTVRGRMRAERCC